MRRAVLYFSSLFVFLTPAPSRAGVMFDFNPLAAGISSTSGADPIELYMESLYGSEITVNRGAQTRKSRVESRPSGLYLGNSDGALDRGPFAMPPGHLDPKDTFLINRWNATSLPVNVRDRIVIVFEEEPISSIAFDWEIFPVTRNGQQADITVLADGAQIFHQELFGWDKERGDLGHFAMTFASPVHRMEFIDWTDAPIGIDNLYVTHPMPEPGTLTLLSLGALGTALSARRRRNVA